MPTADYPPIEGGISTVALSLARALGGLGHEVTVIAPRLPGGIEGADGPGVTVMRYGGYNRGWLRLLPLLLATRRHLPGHDALLAVNIAYGGIAGWLLGARYVTFAYAYEFLKFARVPGMAALLRRVYARSLFTVAISRFTASQLGAFGVDPASVETILPGASPARLVPGDVLDDLRRRFLFDADRIVLAVGRFVPRKGHETLVRAWPRVLESHPRALLVMAGQGPEISPVARLARALGVRDRVLLPGRLDDDHIRGLYALCDVFSLPTGTGPGGQVEGFGLVFVEAGSYGKPVVAGRSGGVEDAVVDGETGILVPPEDPDAVADALLRLLGDPALAARMGAAGRDRAERLCNWGAFTRGLLDALGRRT
jgi:phosphatidyl-myo-inositol dimannoside synthase